MAVSQNRSACALEQVGGTKRHVIRCSGGLSIVVEAAARYRLLDRNRDGTVDAVELRSKALLIDLPTQRRSSTFEVVTPQAVAAVRGTKWAVDVAPGKTAVFVVRGNVGVRKASGGQEVGLSAGQGVDVGPQTQRLTVRRWGRPRIAALMARLGE
jgi:hypothetical protein